MRWRSWRLLLLAVVRAQHRSATVHEVQPSSRAPLCAFASGVGVGRTVRLLAAPFADEHACARAVVSTLEWANGVIHEAANGHCSAVLGMATIEVDPGRRRRSCFLYPASPDQGGQTVCSTEPAACDSLPESEGGSPFTGQELVLPHRAIAGRVPTELGVLLQLSTLDLSHNDLSGTLPSELGQLTRLQRLALPRNSISGAIPSELGRLSRLKALSLYGNALRGALPSQIGKLSPAWCYLSNTQWPFDDLPDTNRFDCPLPPLFAGCGMNGLAFRGRDAHHPGNCTFPSGNGVTSSVLAPMNAYTAGVIGRDVD